MLVCREPVLSEHKVQFLRKQFKWRRESINDYPRSEWFTTAVISARNWRLDLIRQAGDNLPHKWKNELRSRYNLKHQSENLQKHKSVWNHQTENWYNFGSMKVGEDPMIFFRHFLIIGDDMGIVCNAFKVKLESVPGSTRFPSRLRSSR